MVMKQSTIAVVAAVILAVGASFALGYMSARRRYERPAKRADTTYITKWERDTIIEYVSRPGKPVYVSLPVHDTTAVHDTTTIVDSVVVEVPIEERTYTGENYRAVVSGFDPKLVDIWVKQKTQVVRIPYHEHWSVTVGPQLGYGFTAKGWQPYAGVGLTFGYSF